MDQRINSPARSRGLGIMAACVAVLSSVSGPLAQPVRGPQADAVQQAIRDEKHLANDIIDDDTPCTTGVRAQIERETDEMLGRLASLSGIAARAGDQATVETPQQASRKLGEAVEDYIDDCGSF